MKIFAFTFFSSVVGFFGSFSIVSYFDVLYQSTEPPVSKVQMDPPVVSSPTAVEELPSIWPETQWTCSTDLECVVLAEAIYHESRGEPVEGQIAVAHVILNRVNSPYWPDTILEVVYNNCHFSYVCDGSLERGVSDLDSFDKAVTLASDVMNGVHDDPSNGADHYFNPKKTKFVPDWSFSYSRVATIGNHVFHKRG